MTLLFGFAGGYGDASSYLITKAFAGFITGNSVLFCIALAHLDRGTMALLGAAVLFFLAGSGAGIAMHRVFGSNHARRTVIAACLCEVALIAITPWLYDVGGANRAYFYLAPVCIALGLQNGIFSKPSGVHLHTSYMTGTTTALLRTLLGKEDDATARRAKRTTISADWAGFFAGALLAAVLERYFGVRAIWLLIVPLVAAAVVESRAPSVPRG